MMHTRRLATLAFTSILLVVGSPATAGTYATPSQRAAEWLEAQQDHSDGSWYDASEARTFLQTAEAVLALHQTNHRRVPYYAGQTWIENHDPQNIDARARRLLVLRASQSSAQPDIDALLTAVSTPAAGQAGWGLALRYNASPLDTALALDALRTAGAVFNSANTIAYLKSTQLSAVGDQGWPTAAGATTDAYTTARVVQALAPYQAYDPTLATPLANAVATLKGKVSTSSPPHLRAVAALAYLRLDPSSADAKTLLDSLAALQRADGGYDAGVFATGLIVQAFAAAEGVDALVARERVGIPDLALQKEINTALGRSALDQLNKGELAQLTSLSAVQRGITDLTGLQFATNLSDIDLRYNKLTSLIQLSPFTSAKHLLLTGNPLTIAPTADSDGDGVKDQNEVDVGSNPFNATSKPWLKNYGTLVDLTSLYASTPQIAWQTGPWHVAAEDFDHDGDIDLVLYFNGASENVMELSCYYDCGGWYMGPNFGVVVYLENVAGTYVRRSFSNSEDIINGDIEKMIPLDFNNDGKSDLLLVMNEASTSAYRPEFYTTKPYRRLVLMKNDSGPSYVNAQNPSGAHFTDVTTAVGLENVAWYGKGLVIDLNRDGYPDILATTVNGSVVTGRALLFDKVSGKFVPTQITGIPDSLSLAGVVDINNDGRLDLVVQDYTLGLRFFRNNGDLSFTEWTNTGNLSSLSGKYLVKIVPDDMDNDGLQDLMLVETDVQGGPASPQYAGSKARLLRNLGIVGNQITVVEVAVPTVAIPGGGMDVAYGGAVGDIDNDGNLDVVLAGTGSAIFLSDGSGNYVGLGNDAGMHPLDGLNERYADPVLIDYNADGKLDLLSPNGGNLQYHLLLNTGNWSGTRNSIDVELTGRDKATIPSSGKDAFGARVQVTAGGRTITQQVLPIMGKSRILHFGLGSASSGIQVSIFWPDSPTTPQVISGDSYVNSMLKVSEP